MRFESFSIFKEGYRLVDFAGFHKPKYLFWVLSIAGLFYPNIALAQVPTIVTDGTTPSTPTNCLGDCLIDGGLLRGGNLFHSFSRFNVGSGSTVLFSDPGVTNILTRVTGISKSNINGILGVTGGNANLFLLNPNGIIFGPGASLNVQGSFVATTAHAIQFGRQGILSTLETSIPNLTINPSSLLFGNQTTSIEVNSSILSVPSGRNLGLISNEIKIENQSVLAASGGQIFLGTIQGSGAIDLNINGRNFDYYFPSNLKYGNVSLLNGSFLFVPADTDLGGGEIFIYAQDIVIKNSFLRAGVLEQGTANTQAGDIVLHAQEKILITDNSQIDNSVFTVGNSGNIRIKANQLTVDKGSFLTANLIGTGDAGSIFIEAGDIVNLSESSDVQSIVGPEAKGNGGDIFITTPSLLMEDDSMIASSSLGDGNTGNIVVRAESVLLASESDILANIQAGGKGKGGTISIHTDTLSLVDGSQIVANLGASTDNSPGGIGEGGDIEIFATEIVDISGTSSQSGLSSGLVTATEPGTIGNAGDITVRTGALSIAEGAIISAQTFNSGSGGDIAIFANSFEALNGGQVLTTTSNNGDSGSIELNVTDSILLSGSDPTFTQRQAEFPDRVGNEGPASGIFASSRPGSQGQAGDIIIDPQIFIIRDGAQIAVNSQGSSPAGNITLVAGNLTLDSGTISATSTSGQGGNIDLDIDNLLLLRNNSSISASAGNQNKGGDGGNITINTDLLVALENSDITANAFTGRGGNIKITARGVFLSPDSDITASSEFGIDGQVDINNPEVDPSQSLTELPETVEPPQEVAQGCRPGQALGGSTFTHVGRGGLPPGPHETQTPTTVWQDLRAHNLQPTPTATTDPSPSSLTPPPSITEAKGWVKDDQGRVYLTANVPQSTQIPQPTTTC